MVLSSAELKDIMQPHFRRILDTSRSFFPSSNGVRKEGFSPDVSSLGDECPENRTFLHISPKPESGQLDHDGFDLRVGTRIYRTDKVSLSVKEEDLIKGAKKHYLDLGESFVLLPDEHGENVYYIITRERIKKSPDLEFLVDSKSTSARVGIMTHQVGRTNNGEIITQIQPYSFSLEVIAGKTMLSQTVLRYAGTPFMTIQEILENRRTAERKGIDLTVDGTSVLEKSLKSRGVLLHYNTHLALVALRYNRDNMPPIPMDALKGSLDWEPYFEIEKGNSKIDIPRRRLCLMGGIGVVYLGAQYAILTREHDILGGTCVLNNLAVFFHFGYAGEITLEVLPSVGCTIHHGDPAGEIVYDKIEGTFDKGALEHTGIYQGHKAPMLAGMFKQLKL